MPHFRFMFFDRNWIHPQAFGEIPPAKLIPRGSSSSTFHHFIILSYYNYQKFGSSEIPKFKKWKAKVSKNSKILKFRFLRKMFSPFSRDVPWFFLDLIQVILSNKLKKYGLPGPKTLIIHEMLSFRCLMPWNRDFISLPWRRKIQLRHSNHYLINIMPYFGQKWS